MRKILNIIMVLSIIFISSTAFGEKLSNSISKKELHEIIKKYLIENPEIVERALLSLKEKREKEKERITSEKIKSKSKETKKKKSPQTQAAKQNNVNKQHIYLVRGVQKVQQVKTTKPQSTNQYNMYNV